MVSSKLEANFFLVSRNYLFCRCGWHMVPAFYCAETHVNVSIERYFDGRGFGMCCYLCIYKELSLSFYMFLMMIVHYQFVLTSIKILCTQVIRYYLLPRPSSLIFYLCVGHEWNSKQFVCSVPKVRFLTVNNLYLLCKVSISLLSIEQIANDWSVWHYYLFK